MGTRTRWRNGYSPIFLHENISQKFQHNLHVQRCHRRGSAGLPTATDTNADLLISHVYVQKADSTAKFKFKVRSTIVIKNRLIKSLAQVRGLYYRLYMYIIYTYVYVYILQTTGDHYGKCTQLEAPEKEARQARVKTVRRRFVFVKCLKKGKRKLYVSKRTLQVVLPCSTIVSNRLISQKRSSQSQQLNGIHQSKHRLRVSPHPLIALKDNYDFTCYNTQCMRQGVTTRSAVRTSRGPPTRPGITGVLPPATGAILLACC